MTPLGVQVGVVVCLVGVFLTALGALAWVTLRLSGSRTTPPLRQVGVLLKENPFEASLAVMTRLVRLGLVVVALGGAVTILAALVGLVT